MNDYSPHIKRHCHIDRFCRERKSNISDASDALDKKERYFSVALSCRRGLEMLCAVNHTGQTRGQSG
ncbi:MAG: hypothetical protein ACP5UA_09875 [Candidatus Hydrogenedens sp.]